MHRISLFRKLTFVAKHFLHLYKVFCGNVLYKILLIVTYQLVMVVITAILEEHQLMHSIELKSMDSYVQVHEIFNDSVVMHSCQHV